MLTICEKILQKKKYQEVNENTFNFLNCFGKYATMLHLLYWVRRLLIELHEIEADRNSKKYLPISADFLVSYESNHHMGH